jgi:hypothetical protein
MFVYDDKMVLMVDEMVEILPLDEDEQTLELGQIHYMLE